MKMEEDADVQVFHRKMCDYVQMVASGAYAPGTLVLQDNGTKPADRAVFVALMVAQLQFGDLRGWDASAITEDAWQDLRRRVAATGWDVRVAAICPLGEARPSAVVPGFWLWQAEDVPTTEPVKWVPANMLVWCELLPECRH